VFNLESPDGEFGFPGNKKVRVTYTLTDKNELKIEYRLTTDKPCHFNLTNHSYFNLRGEGNGDVTGHFVVINANKVTVVDEFMIPTGEIADIRGTDLDFTKPYTIGSRLNSEFPILKNAGGYDFNYVINRKKSGMVFAASAYEPESGRFMETFTTEPGIQFFSANHMKGLEIGKRGNSYQKHAGFCFETQHYPDSPNQPSFPTTLLKPGQELKSSTVYRFSVK
jgi:aldose 1-epimerase